MLGKPKSCCPCGSYECQTPMPIGGRVQGIDFCIADIVAALNAANIRTVASCCGHGDESKSSIVLEDGRKLNVTGHVPAEDQNGWMYGDPPKDGTRIEGWELDGGACFIIHWRDKLPNGQPIKPAWYDDYEKFVSEFDPEVWRRFCGPSFDTKCGEAASGGEVE